jgi:hypothetical protein
LRRKRMMKGDDLRERGREGWEKERERERDKGRESVKE